MDTIELRSDNSAGIAPEILAAVAEADEGSALAYGADDVTDRLQQTVRTVFEHDGARVFPVTSGTAANALSLSALCPPWGSVLCHSTAHILVNEGGATSMFMLSILLATAVPVIWIGGTVGLALLLTLIKGRSAPEGLDRAFAKRSVGGRSNA